MEMAFFISLLAAGIRSGTGILFATLGEIFAERAGVLNVGIEGMMLMGAVTGYGVAAYTGNPWLALLCAVVVGGLMALLHAVVTITLRADQVVSGLALTFLGSGLSAVVGAPLVEIRTAPKLPAFPIPGLSSIPVIGPIFFDQNVVVYIGFILAPLCWYYIYRTRPGMELRAIGEYPAAADVLGINVNFQRYLYVCAGGMLAGLGGASLSLAITPLWIEGMTAGQGWIALGLVIFAGWNPLQAAFGSYLFGTIRRLPLDSQKLGFFLANPQFGYFMNMLPYLFTIVLMVISARGMMRRRMGSPAALGQPYVREERGKYVAAANPCRLYLVGREPGGRGRPGAAAGSRLPAGGPGRHGPGSARQAAGCAAFLSEIQIGRTLCPHGAAESAGCRRGGAHLPPAPCDRAGLARASVA
jgi:simple sugar transport system permease protein